MTSQDGLSLGPDSARFESVGPSAPKGRLAAWDAARLLATFAIVWTHVAEAHGQPAILGTLGRFGTSFYILAAALFTVRSGYYSPQRDFSDEVVRKAKRLLLPFLTWSALYFAYYGYGALKTGQSWESLTQWWGPAAGTAIHLWFLPFIYIWGLIGWFLVPQLRRLPRLVHLWLCLPLCFVIYWVSYRWIFFAVDRYWLWDWHLHRLDRWIDEAPLYLAAIIMGTYFHRISDRKKQWLRLHRPFVGVTCLVIFLVAQFIYAIKLEAINEATGTAGRFMANIVGLALLCGSATLSETRFVKKIAPWGRYTYVAFLAHMLVLEFLRHPMKQLPGYGSFSVALVCSIGVFAGSIVVSMAIMNSRYLKWLRP